MKGRDDHPTRQEQPRYLSYLLRLWQTRSDRQLVWRASIESAHSGERHSFADLDTLCLFVRQEMDVIRDPEAKKGGTSGQT